MRKNARGIYKIYPARIELIQHFKEKNEVVLKVTGKRPKTKRSRSHEMELKVIDSHLIIHFKFLHTLEQLKILK